MQSGSTHLLTTPPCLVLRQGSAKNKKEAGHRASLALLQQLFPQARHEGDMENELKILVDRRRQQRRLGKRGAWQALTDVMGTSRRGGGGGAVSMDVGEGSSAGGRGDYQPAKRARY